jgi:hypothetical protein
MLSERQQIIKRVKRCGVVPPARIDHGFDQLKVILNDLPKQ